MGVRTLTDLVRATGISRATLEKRRKYYPIKEEPLQVGSGLVYEEGTLMRWHDRIERIVAGTSHELEAAIRDGETAARHGVAYSENPFDKVENLQLFCAWCAGWNDEQKVLTEKLKGENFKSQVNTLKHEFEAGDCHA